MGDYTIICGDTHGNWANLNKLINQKKPKAIIIAGDYGWWPHFHGKFGLSKTLTGRPKKFNQFGVKNKHSEGVTKVFWIPGNHENWDDLKCITDYTPIEIQEDVTYCPFGTVLEIEGMNILCCGGAESIDKDYRIPGVSWWHEEVITQSDMDNLPECDIDIVVSHTVPRHFISLPSLDLANTVKLNDPSTMALQLIYHKYEPKRWYFGHFHRYMHTEYKGCEITGLSCESLGIGRWWTKL